MQSLSRAPKTLPALPDFRDLKYDRSGSELGGSGAKDIYVDRDGNEYLYKPAVTKRGAAEPFRAFAQEGASHVAARITDAGDYVQVRAVDIAPGKAGTYQRIIPDVTELRTPVPRLTPSQVIDLQREHVVDWLIGNFDTSRRNFIVKSDGTIIGVDKEQAFRYITDPASKKMSLTYHPNKPYGAPEPIYNELFRAFRDGKIKLDLQATVPFLQRVETIDDATYRSFFHEYAYRIKKTSKEAEALLDQIVARKNSLRDTYRQFYAGLMKARDP